MHFTNRASSTTAQLAEIALTGLLVLGLALLGAGCDGGGANGDDPGDGEDPGDGNGDDTTAPAAPADLSGDSENSAVDLTWGAVDADDLDGYDVYRDTDSGVDASGDPLEGGLSETTYTDEGAENGTTYYYVVTAVDTAGNGSDPSNEIEKTPFDEPPDRP